MKQVFLFKGKAIVINIPPPSYSDKEVLVKTHYSIISAGTEKISLESSGRGIFGLLKKQPDLIKQGIEFYKRKGLNDTIKLIKSVTEKDIERTGYSCCGEVIKVGDKVNDLSIGDLVACAGAGYSNHAEINAIPRNLCCKVPDKVSTEEAAFTTIGSIALQGVRRSNVQIGDIVVVIGLGLIGLITVQILNAAGCRVLGVDINERKIQFAKQYGLEKGFEFNPNIVEELNNYCDNIGADKTIICASTASNDPIELAISITRKRGRIIAVGLVGMNIPRKDFYKKEIDFGLSCSYGPGRYDNNYEEKGIDYPYPYVRWTENRNMQAFLKLIEQNKVDLASLIEKRYSLEEAFEAFESLNNQAQKPAILFKYQPSKVDIKTSFHISTKSKRIDKNIIKVGLIGAGSFSQNYHLPNINNIEELSLVCISDKNGDTCKKISNQYKLDYYTTNYNEIIEDDNIDMVIISTRHNLHSEIVLKCIEKGKHIFVEKPLCMTKDELSIIEERLKTSSVNLCVGFNRRFSPMILDIKNYINNNSLLEKSLIINIRINSAGMTADSWVNDPEEGGGAIIGEACHFFDLMNFLAESKPNRIQTSSISSDDKSIINDNNIIANIKYQNGVLGSILYSTIGNKAYPKERFEFFGKNTNIFLDNYKEMEIVSNKYIKKKYKGMNKGHYKLLESYTQYLRNNYNKNIELPLNEYAINSMKLTFNVINNLKQKL